MYEDDEAAAKLPPPLKLSAHHGGAAAANGAANGGSAAAAGEADGSLEAEHSSGSEEEEEEAGGAADDAGDEGAGGADGGSGSDDEHEAQEAAEEATAAGEAAAGSLTLQGLVRRMARLADDKTYARQLQRGVALRFVAAAATRLGPQRALPFLPLLMRPLYRITEPGGSQGPLTHFQRCSSLGVARLGCSVPAASLGLGPTRACSCGAGQEAKLHLSLTRSSPHLPCPPPPSCGAGASGNPPDVVTLADEIVAHLRGLVGGDAMLAGYSAAREAVRRQRGERKKKAALQVGGPGAGKTVPGWGLRHNLRAPVG